MPHLPFTADWAAAFCVAVNADERYRAAAARWSWPVALVLAAEPALGYPADVAVEAQLGGGRCAGARLVPADEVGAPIVLRGGWATWKRIFHGELDPIAAVTRGELRVVRGSLMTLMMHVGGARALVDSARTVDTAFPDE